MAIEQIYPASRSKLLRNYLPVNRRPWHPWKWEEGQDPTKWSSGYIAKVRDIALRDFFFFSDWIMRDPDDPNLHELHAEVCWITQLDEECGVLVPRYHLKSTLCTVAHSLWRLAKNQNTRILLKAATEPVAEGFLNAIKQHIVANHRYKTLFPEVKPQTRENGRGLKLWNTYSIECERSKIFSEPSILAVGAKTNLTGLHFDLAIYDDLMAEENAKNEDSINEIIRKFEADIFLMVAKSRRFLVGTRYDDKDLYGHLMDNREFEFYIRAANEGGKWIWPNPDIIAKIQRDKKNCTPYVYSCNPGYAPVWMADGTFKEIKDIQVGESVVGIRLGTPKDRSNLLATKVLAITSKKADLVKIKTASGRTIICTPDHQWMRAHWCRDKNSYKPAKIGGLLAHVIDPPKPISVEEQINYGKPAKSYQIMNALLNRGKRVIDFPDKIVSIEPHGNDTVYSMQTETGNYIIWGYASKNCQMMNNPIDKDTQEFKSDFKTSWDTGTIRKEMENAPEDDLKLMDVWYRSLDIYLGLDPARAEKEVKRNSSIAMIAVGVDKRGREYLLEYRKFKGIGAIRLVEEWVEFIVKWSKYPVRMYGQEAQGGDNHLVEPTLKALKERKLPFSRHKVFIPPKQENKEERIRELQLPWENRLIVLHAVNHSEIEQEFDRFPRGREKDVMDIWSHLHREIRPKREHKEKRKEAGWRKRRSQNATWNWKTG